MIDEVIIPYREILGSYNKSGGLAAWFAIIPYREILGSYNQLDAKIKIQIQYKNCFCKNQEAVFSSFSAVILPHFSRKIKPVPLYRTGVYCNDGGAR